MPGLQKRQLALLIAVGTSLAPMAAAAQSLPAPPVEAEEPESDAAKLDALFVELAEPGRDDWERIGNEIIRIWSKSGSPSMDLLLRRGNEALEAEDLTAALEHFSALTDHAPDFAEGWNGRATTFYLMDEYALAIADVERVLALEPRHFGALSGLAFMLEAMDEPELALEALQMVQTLNPNRPNINQAVTRLEQMHGEADL
jgi:tetratricopeptide (TPR) repeat protein